MVDISNRVLYGKRDLSTELEFQSFRDAIAYRVEHFPDVALYSYTDYNTNTRTEVMPKELQEQCQALSTWLFEKGYERKNIGLIGDSSYPYLLAVKAIVCSNNVAVPMDKSLEEETLHEFLVQSDCSALFYSKNYEERAQRFKEELGIEIFLLDEIDQLVQEGRELLAQGKDACLKLEPDVDAPAVILFTSGTTGKSKGVMLSQRNITADMILDIRESHFTYDGVIILPFHHAYGLTNADMIFFLYGKTLHINQNMRYMFRDFQTENPEGLVCVPLHLEVFYNAIWKNIRDQGREEEIRSKIEENRKNKNLTNAQKREMFRDVLSVMGNRFRAASSGGAPLNLEVFYGLRDFGIEVNPGYGITECSPMVSCNSEEDMRPESVGRIMEGLEVMVANPDKNKEGEICLRGPIVMLGYYKDEEATKEALKDGWLYTGDMGYVDKDNYIYLSGRKKNLIILANGENVSPEELEGKIMGCHAVKEVVVYEKNKKITAQIFADPEYAGSEEGVSTEDVIRKYISEVNSVVPNFKQIAAVEFRKTPFARNSSQKILRSSLE